MLRQDEEKRAEVGSGEDDEEGPSEGHVPGQPTTLHPGAPASAQIIDPQATTSNSSSPHVAPIPDDDIDDVPGTIRSNLSPTSRRRFYMRFQMRRKRAEASGCIAELDPARLKPVRKVNATSKFRILRVKDEDGTWKRRACGDMRPYKIRCER